MIEPGAYVRFQDELCRVERIDGDHIIVWRGSDNILIRIMPEEAEDEQQAE